MKPVYWLILGLAIIGGCTAIGVASLFVDADTTNEAETSELVSNSDSEEAEPTSTPKPTNTPKPENFKKAKDWEEAKCGKKDFAEDLVKAYIEARNYSYDGRSHIRAGWTQRDKEFNRGDFPRYYTYPVHSKNKNAAGRRHLAQYTVVFNYQCDVTNSKWIDRGWR